MGLGGQVERRRCKNRGATSAESRPIWGVMGPPENNVSFLGVEMRILVHSPAYLSVCFCTVIHPLVQTSSTPAQSDIPG